MDRSGTIVLLGGDDVGNRDLGEELIALSGGGRVAVVPTASAFELPERCVVDVGEWLGPFGVEIEGLMASSRTDAQLDELADRLTDASLAYLCDGTALHLRTTLRDTALFRALGALVDRGGVLAASGDAATVLCDPMVDPRGGAPTVGLGPITAFTVVPHVGHDQDDPHTEKLHRTVQLAPKSLPVVALRARSALVCRNDGGYDVLGDGDIEVYIDGSPAPGGTGVLAPWR